jgi:amino acid transporter
VTLSAIARLFYYAVGCAALPVLRRKRPEGAMFRLPGGTLFAALGIAICLVLISQVDFGQSMILIATIAIALMNWAVVARGKAVGWESRVHIRDRPGPVLGSEKLTPLLSTVVNSQYFDALFFHAIDSNVG